MSRSKIKRVRQAEMKAAARAFKFQCLEALNKAVLRYLRSHPEISLKTLAAKINLSKKELVRKLSRADTLTFRDMGEIASVIDAEIELSILPIENAASAETNTE